MADLGQPTGTPREEKSPTEHDQQQQQQPEAIGDEPGHIPMARRLSLVSWGAGSGPSLPSVDTDDETLVDSGDSAVGSFISSTMSIRSSTYDYVEENGRTYHRYKEGKYPLPNDLQEQERLDLQHALFLVTTHGELHLAPIGENPQNILDVATGTGIWAVEFAQSFPGAEVLGTDLSPIQPEYIPPNVRFEIDDAEDEWTFGMKFDYIHGRALLTCFKDPPAVIKQAFDALVPGGYLELQDAFFPFTFASTPPANCALYKWSELVTEAAARSGRPWTHAQYYKRYLEEAGFEDVVEKRFYWPMNPWPRGSYYKAVGRFFMEDMLNGVDGISFKVLGSIGWSIDEIGVLLAQVRNDMRDPSIHSYLNIVFVYGKKPKPSPPPANS